jgi:GT2 family glycosyltransferase
MGILSHGFSTMNVFGMVTTRHSDAYTGYALESFFGTTPLAPDDRFVLIDNDGTYVPPPGPRWARVTRIVNRAPLGFAANVNQVMRIARERGADLFFLNNDLIFTPGWLEPLRVREATLLSPVSNFQFPYRCGDWDCGRCLDLADYLGHQDDLREIARAHQARAGGYQHVLKVPFFCIKIPYAIQEAVGYLDEDFGRGGGEDDDYCLRCHLAGFSVAFALGSYLLHFVGKSTWRGAESPDESRHRERRYLTALRAKWGDPLAEAMVLGRKDKLLALPGVGAALAATDFEAAVKQALRMEGSLTPVRVRPGHLG